jgi:crotonobetainyl-CoA:carnitine CoA-transferase CaiB-like acyl-CoA transferase
MVQDIPEVMTDKQLTAREMFWKIDDTGIGLHTNMANPKKLSATPPTLRNASPLLGKDTDKVLARLGYTEAEIAAMRENGAI